MLKLGRAGRYRRLGVIAQMAIAITTMSAAMECIAGARLMTMTAISLHVWLMTMTAISHTCRLTTSPIRRPRIAPSHTEIRVVSGMAA